GGQRRQSIRSTFCPAVIDADIAMLDITASAQAAPERVNDVHELAGRFHAEKPDHRHPRLLPARRERPRGSRAAEQRDELASAHWAYATAKGHGPEYSTAIGAGPCTATKSGGSFPLRVKSGISEGSRGERNVRFGPKADIRPMLAFMSTRPSAQDRGDLDVGPITPARLRCIAGFGRRRC